MEGYNPAYYTLISRSPRLEFMGASQAWRIHSQRRARASKIGPSVQASA